MKAIMETISLQQAALDWATMPDRYINLSTLESREHWLIETVSRRLFNEDP